MDLLTISSRDGIGGWRDEEREARVEGLFPERGERRARRFESKQTVWVSARVHPGETPCQFVFDGFLEFILRVRVPRQMRTIAGRPKTTTYSSPEQLDDPRAEELRRHFVFKLVPILNPDGVANGHYRADTRGVNLNRCYQRPNNETEPTIFAAVQLLRCVRRTSAEAAPCGPSFSPWGRSAILADMPPHARQDCCCT